MTTETLPALRRYEAARAALQAAHDVDEVKEIRDKAQAMAAYAKQANDTKLVELATEIKVRAERKAGEMLAELERHQGKRTDKTSGHDGPKSLKEVLDENDIAPTTAKRWQKLAAVTDEQFEQAVTAAKEVAGEVTTAALLRRTSGHDGPKSAKPAAKGTKPSGDAAKLQARISELEEQLAETKESLAEMTDLVQTLKAHESGEQVKEMQVLRLELRSCKRRRDELMRENAEQKKMIAYWKKKAEKK